MRDVATALAALGPRRSLLYLPASNPRAIVKARTLPCDMVILDLEDAVRDGDKRSARDAAVAAIDEGFGEREAGIRVNAADSPHHDADLAAIARSAAAFVVLPKVAQAGSAAKAARLAGKPLLAMIETPAGVLAAAAIAAADGVAGLIAGTNDLAATLRLPAGGGRAALSLALQQIVLAARAADGLAFDGVFNALDDAEGFAAECAQGRALGFDGKSLIHPNQIDAANAAFGPSTDEIEDARALVAAATGGAERFRGRMIETMHVDAARRLLALIG